MNEQSKGLLLVFFGVLLMSIESPLIKLSDTNYITFAFYYGLFISISTFCIIIFHGFEYFKKAFKTECRGVLLAGIFIGLSNICFVSAVKHTSVANVLLILATAPIVCAVFAKIFLKMPIPRHILIITFFIIIGLTVMLYSEIGGGNMFGNILAFGTLFSFSSLFVVANRYIYANRFAYILIGGLVICIFGFLGSVGSCFKLDNKSLYILIFLGLITVPISRYLMGIGAKYIHPSQTGILTSLESVIAPILAIFILHEYPKTNTIIGGGIILFAITLNALITLKGNKKRKN